MIISKNSKPSLREFEKLVGDATVRLNDEAKKRSNYFLKRNAQLLEDDVRDALEAVARGTSFEGTIEKVSGQKFPDIVAAGYYGVEVKSSKDEKWLSLGGSVNESTRIDGVERIFLMFGKLVAPVEFRSRPYEDCLSEVVATHYPRYKIDMNLGAGETIFDKMQMSYDRLRATGNAVGEIIAYYKGQLKKGESLWWIDNSDTIEENTTSSIKVRLWGTLTEEERNDLMLSMIIFFPEIFGNSNKKYERAALWLASRHGVVSTSMRDPFSAGGRVTLSTERGVFKDLPQIFGHVCDLATHIRRRLDKTPESVLCDMWNTLAVEKDRLFQWICLVSENCKLKNCDSHLCRTVLSSIFDMRQK